MSLTKQKIEKMTQVSI